MPIRFHNNNNDNPPNPHPHVNPKPHNNQYHHHNQQADMGVMRIQLMLNALGYQLYMDGIFSDALAGAVQHFQAQTGMQATGQLDQATVGHLHHTFINSPIQINGITVQYLLFFAGFDTGNIMEALTKQGIAAIGAFQHTRGLQVNGELDDPTIYALKLALYQ